MKANKRAPLERLPAIYATKPLTKGVNIYSDTSKEKLAEKRFLGDFDRIREMMKNDKPLTIDEIAKIKNMISIAWEKSRSNFKELGHFMDPKHAKSIYQNTQKLFLKKNFASFASKSEYIREMLRSLPGLVEDKDKGITFSGNIEKINNEIQDLYNLYKSLSHTNEPIAKLKELLDSVKELDAQLLKLQQQLQQQPRQRFYTQFDEIRENILRLGSPHYVLNLWERFDNDIQKIKDDIESLESFQKKHMPNDKVLEEKIGKLLQGVEMLEQNHFLKKFDIPSIEIETKIGRNEHEKKQQLEQVKKHLDSLDIAQTLLSKETQVDEKLRSGVANKILEARSKVAEQLRILEIKIELPTEKNHDEIKRTTKAIVALCKANDKGAEACIRSLTLEQLQDLKMIINKRNEHMNSKSGKFYQHMHSHEKEQLKFMKECVENRIKFLQDPSAKQTKDIQPK